MRFVSVREMREMDRRTIESGVPGETLMERAGRGVAAWAARMADAAGPRTPLLVVAGKGNNGGDGFVAARVLARRGYPVEVLLCAAAEDLRGDASIAFRKLAAAGVRYRERPDGTDRSPDELGSAGQDGLVIDALLGTGTTGAPRGAVGTAVASLARGAGRCGVLAIDVPSGLNADTGEAAGDVVRADLTVTLGLPKTGFLNPAAQRLCGRIETVDIGLLDSEPTRADSATPLGLSADGLRSLLPGRRRDAHKGAFGHVLVVAGSRGYTGAPVLCARGCVRAGAGLVSVAVPAELATAVALGVPEAMVQPIAGESGRMRREKLQAWGGDFDRFDVLVVGPGLGREADTESLVRGLLAAGRARVYDADALNVLAGTPGTDEIGRGGTTVITPHPGEAARLLGTDPARVQADRLAALKALVERTGATVVLKGAGTLVGAPGRPAAVSLGGNPGMATGGTGDVLAGMIGALLAQGLAPYDAARLGVYLHAAAGDLAAWQTGQAALRAGDLPERLGMAFRLVSAR